LRPYPWPWTNLYCLRNLGIGATIILLKSLGWWIIVMTILIWWPNPTLPRQFSKSFGKRIGLRADLYGNGSLTTKKLADQMITDLLLKINRHRKALRTVMHYIRR